VIDPVSHAGRGENSDTDSAYKLGGIGASWSRRVERLGTQNQGSLESCKGKQGKVQETLMRCPVFLQESTF